MSGLDGRSLVITGGARGLGYAIAEHCATAGARVALFDILNDRGKAAATALGALGAEAVFHPVDVTKGREVDAAMAAVGTRWGGIDGLVNCAALATGLGGQTFEQIDEAEWDRVMAINVKGTWIACREAAPYLRKSGSGRIVNIASDVALWGADLFAHYVASKGAVIALTRALARELGSDGVTVNAVAPGLTPTEATEGASERRWRQYEDGRVLDRGAAPRDTAGAVGYLLSDGAGFVTGQTLVVDGGFVMG